MFILNFCLSILLFCLTGCGRQSLEDFREEGEGVTCSIKQELQSVHTREDLVHVCPRLQKLFNELVDIVIAAKEYREKHAHLEELELSKENHELSDQLRVELNRVYRIEGGRELVEKCQEQALHRLDAFEKRLAKKRSD